MRLYFIILMLSASICTKAYAQKTPFAVEVSAFAERVPLTYFKIGGVYESVDENLIYRYRIDAPDRPAAERLRQQAIDAGHKYARVVDFEAIREACAATCGYTPPQRLGNLTSTGTSAPPVVTANNSNAAGGSDNTGKPIRLTGPDLYVYWSKELKRMGIPMDSANLYLYWKKNKEQIGLDSAGWMQLWAKEFGNPSSGGGGGIRITNADMYFKWSKELKEKGIPMQGEALGLYWSKNKTAIGMDSSDWMALWKRDIEQNLPGINIGLNEEERVRCIFFDYNSHALRTASVAELDKLYAILKKNTDFRLEIGAHTDSRGGADYNRRLSLRRANSARKYLISKGISSSRIALKYYGKEQPIARNEYADGTDCPDGRQLNRRVEFLVFNAKGEKISIVLPIDVPQNLRY